MGALMRIEVTYFAVLREQRGLNRESLEIGEATGSELYARLSGAHGFSLPASLVRLAVNGAFRDPELPLNEGDQVAFIPPVAGG
jgi:molybdopterin converting factor subunit 1